MTPEEKLCSRSWRIRNSAGVLWPILSFGMLGCVVFLVRGVKSRTTWWWVLGIVFGAISLGLMVSMQFVDSGTKENPSRTVASGIQSSIMFVNWLASSVMAFVINRKWLLWKAHNGGAWYAAPGQHGGGGTNPLPATAAGPAAQPWPAQQFGAQPTTEQNRTQQTPFASTPQTKPTGSLNVNQATVADLERLGLDAHTAERIIVVRELQQGFPSFEQMMAATGVQPHQLLAIRGQLAFGPAARQPDASRRLFD